MPVIDLSAYKPVPATLGDANQIANGMQAIQNVLNGIDNLNFAAGKIFDPTKIMQNAAVPRQGLVWDGSNWVPGSGTLDYAQIVAPAGSAATTAATAGTIITGNSVTYDGATPVWIEFFAPAFQHTAIVTVFFMLYDGAAQVGRLFETNSVAANTDKPCFGKIRLTPTAGAHTYSIRAYASGAGTTTVLAGAGGNDVDLAAYLSIIRA